MKGNSMCYKKNGWLPNLLSFKVVFLLIFCLVMVSCNNDEEKNGGITGDAKESIVGTWQSVWYEGYEIEDGIRRDWGEDYTEEVYTFYKDGKGEYKDTDPSISQSYPLHWEIRDNDQLIIDGDEIYTLVTLNDNEMVWEEHEKYGDDIYYAKEVFKRIDQPTSDNTEDSSDTDDTEESSGTNDSETDLSASQQNFVGLWEYTFTINRPGHFLFLSNGRGRVEPYSSGIVAGQDNMNGYWTYDTEKKILSTTMNYQFNITLSVPDAWAGYRIDTNSECKGKRLDNPDKYLAMYLEMVEWEGQPTNLPSSYTCSYTGIMIDEQNIKSSYTISRNYKGTIEISGYSSESPQLTISNNHPAFEYFKSGIYKGTFVD